MWQVGSSCGGSASDAPRRYSLCHRMSRCPDISDSTDDSRSGASCVRLLEPCFLPATVLGASQGTGVGTSAEVPPREPKEVSAAHCSASRGGPCRTERRSRGPNGGHHSQSAESMAWMGCRAGVLCQLSEQHRQDTGPLLLVLLLVPILISLLISLLM